MADTQNNNEFLKKDGGKTKSNAIEIPSIDLPKGGGAVKGIDEKFSVNAVNGTSGFSIPLPFANARGASPSLTLSYSSGAGNGVFGLGWSLSLSSIKRKSDKGLPQYIDATDSDTFLFSEAEDLVPAFKKTPTGHFETNPNGDYLISETNDSEGFFNIRYYLPRTEGLFARIERWTEKSSGNIKWRVTTKDNTTTLFGWTSNAIICDPDQATRIYEWLPEFVFDDKGNCAQYVYKEEDDIGLVVSELHNQNRIKSGKIAYTNRYIDRILYGNKTPYNEFGNDFPDPKDYLFQTVFDYAATDFELFPFDTLNAWNYRSDAFSNYKAGFEIRTTRLCKRVLQFHVFDELALKPDFSDAQTLIKSINFEYDMDSEQDFTFLKSITSWGYIKKPDGSYSARKMPPITFDYQKHEWDKTVKTIASDDLIHAPYGIDEQQYQFTDLFNEGLAGILTEQGNGWYYKQNVGNGNFEPAQLVYPNPSSLGLGNAWQLSDLDADGGKQLVSQKPGSPGYFERDDDQQWQQLRYFRSLPNVDYNNPNMRMLDLNGDGKPELVISDDHVFTWYESLGREGYAAAKKTAQSFDEETGPRVLFSDPQQSIFLADMSGDGLTDILRIRNGEVCYWPNLGYGKFGAKVTLDDAPLFDHPDHFNPAYLRLADIDGSGTTDIIYLGKNKFSCWKNLSGNRFGQTPFEIDAFPDIHPQAKITVIDLLGNGVACIVWSSSLSKDDHAPLRYIDLMNSKKPHVMVAYQNNLGKEVALEYKPSTQFYIEDKRAGRPWVTLLHFPVHCVSKTTTIDQISGYQFTSQYRYHHGYYDHAESEFRGFGMVEQIDSESFEHFAKGNATNIVEATLHQEPVLTKTWNHTGAFLRAETILSQFAQDYWYAEMQRQGFDVNHHELTLPDARLVAAPGIDASLLTQFSATEWQQASRACKGIGLRTEIFAKDAEKWGNTTAARIKELTPFAVSTHNCVIELLQPKGQNKHAVFVVKESEAITYQYERNTEDPRITHNLNLKIDQYGNVLESASVAYPRRISEASLPEYVKQQQDQTVIIYNQNQFTNDVIDALHYRLRLASQTQTFELKGLTQPAAYFTLADFEDVLLTADDAPCDQFDTTPTAPQKRLIEHIRTNYRSNNLKDKLPLHRLESMALPFESYQLAFTPELLEHIYGDKEIADFLIDGRYIPSEGDSNWWIRSGYTNYLKEAENASDAQDRFYVPVSFVDPFGAVTQVRYYKHYSLLIDQTQDALENKATVEAFNFRTLSPKRLLDANGNLSETLTDELGMIKAFAVFGKGNQADNLIGLDAFTNEAETTLIDQFLHVPHLPNGVADSVALSEKAKQLLQHATMRLVYDLDAYQRNRKPTVVASLARETHYKNLEGVVNPDAKIQLSFEYSNGLGQVIMKKVQASPGLAQKVTIQANDTTVVEAVDTAEMNPVQLRWVGNGRTIHNNKGNVVKQYEPYFSVTNQFEADKELVESGVTPLLYYDAMSRLVKSELPDGTFSKVVFDPWKQSHFDANDTVLESTWYTDRISNQLNLDGIKDLAKEKEAAQKAAAHDLTPSLLHFDNVGRPCCSVAHNKRTDFTTNAVVNEFYHTMALLDTEGNLRGVIDAAQNTVVAYKYDLLGNILYQDSMDAGQRWMLNDCMGKPICAWDANDNLFTTSYDSLHRPTISSLTKAGTTIVTDRQEYTDTKGLSALELLAKQQSNLIGKSTLQYDSAGKTCLLGCDFNGNPIATSRQLTLNYKSIPDWTAPEDVALETEVFASTGEFDALNRPVSTHTPATDAIPASVIKPTYNASGMLDALQVSLRGNGIETPFVTRIDYDAKGQREAIYYGNQSLTRYTYDKKTFRLLRLLTTSNNGNNIVQDLRYTYDAVGNITFVKDLAQPTVFYDGQQVKAENNYEYDAIYQLLKASGREHIGQNLINETATNNRYLNFPFEKSANANEANALRNYSEQYSYDTVGNILQLRHLATDANFTRKYWYNNNEDHRNALAVDNVLPRNNRLLQTQIGAGTPTRYQHDIQGNMTNLSHLTDMIWNHKNQLEQIDLGGGGRAYYVYDSSGQRIRKVIERLSGAKEERLYLGALEIYRAQNTTGDLTKQTETLHITDDSSRIAMVDTPTITADFEEQQLIRYIYSNHLGSSCLELDENAVVISYEEYHPYGTTSYSATNAAIKAAAKRYRYTGMERDEESGLAYHSARYYLPWLGRWLSSDPIGTEGGLNLYAYCKGNSIINNDLKGTENIVVVGSQYKTGAGNHLQFAEQGITALRDYRANENNESGTMLIFREGYTANQLQAIQNEVTSMGGNFVVLDSADDLISYVNRKLLKNEQGASSRSLDKVSNLDFFAHGLQGSVEFGYSTSQAANYKLDGSNVNQIDRNAFGADNSPSRQDNIQSYACRTGSGNPSEFVSNSTARPDFSLAQRLANTTNFTVGAFISRSDYSDTLGSASDRRSNCTIGRFGCSQTPELKASMARRVDIDGATFDPQGAMHPVATSTDSLPNLTTRRFDFIPNVTPVLPPGMTPTTLLPPPGIATPLVFRGGFGGLLRSPVDMQREIQQVSPTSR